MFSKKNTFSWLEIASYNECSVFDCFVGERRKLDIEYFSKLLEKILEVQKNRKKLKSLSEKNSPKKHKRKAKGELLLLIFISCFILSEVHVFPS